MLVFWKLIYLRAKSQNTQLEALAVISLWKEGQICYGNIFEDWTSDEWFRFVLFLFVATSSQLFALSRHSRISTASPKNGYRCCSMLVLSCCNILLVLTCLVWVKWITMKILLSHTLPLMSNICFASNQQRPMKIYMGYALNISSPVHYYRIAWPH